MRIALVTGGAGFIGSHLVERLLGQGRTVRVLDNLSTGSLRNLQAAADQHPLKEQASPPPPNGCRLELMIGDIRDEKPVRKAMQHVDCVFHLAALPGGAGAKPADTHTVNVQGTLNVLQAATTEGVRRVVFGSCASVYGRGSSSPVTEDHPTQPISLFAASKLAGEVYCRAYHKAHQLETVALRYFTVYGPRQNGSIDRALVPTLIETLRRRRRPVISGDARLARDFLYVEDAVEATLAAAVVPSAAGRAFNIAAGQTASALEVFDILKRLLRTETALRLSSAYAPLDMPSRARTDLAERLLGCTPRVSLVSGLARAVQFLANSEHEDEGLLAEVGPREERADV